MPTASDVPNKFDVVINGQGYLFAPSDVGLPPSIFGVKNKFGFTPTFIQRQNTSGDFGDNQQDFWLTATQRDWSLGEGQKFFHQSDGDSVRRYYGLTTGGGIDVSVAGQVSMRPDTTGFTAAANIVAMSKDAMGLSGSVAVILYATSTNLYTVDEGGARTDKLTHGLGAAPALWGLATDGVKAYLSCNKTDNGASVGVRKWDGTTYATFSATGVDSLAYLNNTLYGLDWSSGILYRFDTAGTATNIFQWKDSTGTGIRVGRSSGITTASKIVAFGGKLAILLVPTPNNSQTQASLWIYDGTAPSQVATLPPDFQPYDMVVSGGSLYISGSSPVTSSDPSNKYTTTVLFYTGGSIGELWRSSNVGASAGVCWGGLAASHSGLLIQDPIGTSLVFYDGNSNAVSTVATTGLAGPSIIGNSRTQVVSGTVGSTAANYWLPAAAANTVATVTFKTSLFDFDSSLKKIFRGITVEFEAATDGNGGSVDVGYQLENVATSGYSNLVVGATSGVENTFGSTISGRRISVEIVLNKGTSTAGPILKRIAVRAVPIQTSFSQTQYVLFLAGADKWGAEEGNPLPLRDGTLHNKDGAQMAADLVTAAKATSPFSITDGVNGTYTGVADLSNFEISQIKPGEYIAVVGFRQV